jgi:hypothetical protein
MTAIMIDAQFAIKNTKKRSERRREIAMHDGQRGVMLPRILVDAFVSAYTPGKSEKSRCSDFHAVDDAHKSHGSQFLDTTALLTAVCRHDICAAIAQLRHGERYAYALFMLLHVCHLWPATATEKDAKLAAVLVREGKAALAQSCVDTKRAYSGAMAGYMILNVYFDHSRSIVEMLWYDLTRSHHSSQQSPSSLI